MAAQNYGTVQSGRYRKLKKRIIGIIIIAVIVIIAVGLIGVLAGNSAEYQKRVSILEENHRLKEENAQLQQQIADYEIYVNTLQGQVSERDAFIAALPTEVPAEEIPQESETSDEPNQENQINGYAVSPR